MNECELLMPPGSRTDRYLYYPFSFYDICVTAIKTQNNTSKVLLFCTCNTLLLEWRRKAATCIPTYIPALGVKGSTHPMIISPQAHPFCKG